MEKSNIKLVRLFKDLQSCTTNQVEEKLWGFKYVAFKSMHIGGDLCWAKKGGFCSLHYHRYKSNYFHVLFGKLRLDYITKVYEGDRHVTRENYVEIGENCESRVFTIFPNVRHRFTA